MTEQRTARALGTGRAALPDRLAALDEVVALAAGRLDDGLVARARDVRATAAQRLARGEQAVVVALAGGTGGGKSSLFNALAGAPLSRVGPVRPVTGEAIAWAVGDPEPAGAVLDWLGVRRRYHAEAGPGAPDGLVLLDLPDHDSVVTDHRLVVDRFVERVDVLVWVLDPMKYSQRLLHAAYLRTLAAHVDVLLVVLNRIDELGTDARRLVLDDLRRLLASEGLGRAEVLATSARTGEGVAELRQRLVRFVEERRAVADRIAADVRTVAVALGREVGGERTVRLDAGRLAAALGTAAGVEPLADAGARTYRSDADDATRPLLTGAALRRLRRLRSPLRRLSRPAAPRPEVSPVGVRHAVVELARSAADDLPYPWPARLQQAAGEVAADLPGAVAKALDGVDVHAVRPRRWWPAFAVVGTLLEWLTLVGVGWLTALAVLAWLQLPPPPTPRVGEIPWPTLLALGGGASLALVLAVRRRLVRVGASRHRAAVLQRLRAAVAAAAEERAVTPLRAELAVHERLAGALRAAAGGDGTLP